MVEGERDSPSSVGKSSGVTCLSDQTASQFRVSGYHQGGGDYHHQRAYSISKQEGKCQALHTVPTKSCS